MIKGLTQLRISCLVALTAGAPFGFGCASSEPFQMVEPAARSRTWDSPHSGSPALAPAWDPYANESGRIPGGERCLYWLNQLGIAHRLAEAKPGMSTPIELRGEVGGIRYTSAGADTTLCDCRLVLALDWIGPTLRRLGVREIQHSGAYVYRTTRSGRPSMHARGLALDVHRVKFDDALLSVKQDFARQHGCSASAPRLNRLACDLRAIRLFRELITPDHNADHHDHLHLAIMPIR